MNNESVTVYKMIIHYLQVRQCILEMVRAMWTYRVFTGGLRRGTKEKVNEIWAERRHKLLMLWSNVSKDLHILCPNWKHVPQLCYLGPSLFPCSPCFLHSPSSSAITMGWGVEVAASLDPSFGSSHSHLEARNGYDGHYWWLWQFLLINMAGDIFISQWFSLSPLAQSDRKVSAGLSLSILGLRGGNGTPLQYSCLENPVDGGAWWAAVHGVTTSQTRLSDFTFTFHFHALKKEMATYSSVLAWRIPGTGEPGGLPSMGLHRVRHDWSDLAVAVAEVSDKHTDKIYIGY